MYAEKCGAATRNIHGPTIPPKRRQRLSRNVNSCSKRANDTYPDFGIRHDWQQNSMVCYIVLIPPGLTHMSDNARFGFVNFAETWNGRLAMLGFVIGLGTELLTGQGILTQIGLG